MTPFARRVLDVVDAIPAGRVMSYADVGAVLAVRGGRAVGNVLARYGDQVPWHRVVRADGRPARGHEVAALALLRAEGVPVDADGRVDMRRAAWLPGPLPAPPPARP